MYRCIDVVLPWESLMLVVPNLDALQTCMNYDQCRFALNSLTDLTSSSVVRQPVAVVWSTYFEAMAPDHLLCIRFDDLVSMTSCGVGGEGAFEESVWVNVLDQHLSLPCTSLLIMSPLFLQQKSDGRHTCLRYSSFNTNCPLCT